MGLTSTVIMVVVYILDGSPIAPVEPPLNDDSLVVANHCRSIGTSRRWKIRSRHFVLQLNRVAAENLRMLRRVAASLFRRDESQGSIINEQRRAGWDDNCWHPTRSSSVASRMRG